MYIIVKDICHDYGDSSKRVIVLNKASFSEAFRSKNRAALVLKEILEETGEKYKVLNDEKYGGYAYSLWDGAEIFYVYELYIDNSL